MASLLESYEQQYSVITADITSKTAVVPSLSGGEKTEAARQVEKLIDEANELLEQMDLETREIPSENRLKYQTRIESYKAELTRMNKELKKAKVAFRNDSQLRDELFGEESINEDQLTSLLDNTERLDRSTRKLEAGYKAAVETEQIGTEIMENLYSQRHTMNRARDRLRDTDHELGKSSRILSSMMRRIVQNRLLLYVILFVMVVVIVVTIYFTIKKHS